MITIALARDTSARIKGIVVDGSDHDAPVEGVRVGVVGYETEAQITQSGGNFSLPAHGASGQPVQLFAFKKGYDAGPPQWHQAGDSPATVVLRPLHSNGRKP